MKFYSNNYLSFSGSYSSVAVSKLVLQSGNIVAQGRSSQTSRDLMTEGKAEEES
jgi:hypothetical protein